MAEQYESNKFTNLQNWWRVCLTNGYIFPFRKSEDWVMVNITKRNLYETYNKMCIGEMYGSIMFWKYFGKLVNYTSTSGLTVSLPSLDMCRDIDSEYDFAAYENAFTPRMVMVQ
jgi:hypothetical protein